MLLLNLICLIVVCVCVAGEVLGCTAPVVVGSADAIVFVADGRFHLEAIMIANPDIPAFRCSRPPFMHDSCVYSLSIISSFMHSFNYPFFHSPAPMLVRIRIRIRYQLGVYTRKSFSLQLVCLNVWVNA